MHVGSSSASSRLVGLSIAECRVPRREAVGVCDRLDWHEQLELHRAGACRERALLGELDQPSADAMPAERRVDAQRTEPTRVRIEQAHEQRADDRAVEPGHGDLFVGDRGAGLVGVGARQRPSPQLGLGRGVGAVDDIDDRVDDRRILGRLRWQQLDGDHAAVLCHSDDVGPVPVHRERGAIGDGRRRVAGAATGYRRRDRRHVDGRRAPDQLAHRAALADVGLAWPRHASRQAERVDVHAADLIIGLAPEHIEWIRREHADVSDRSATLIRLTKQLPPATTPLAQRISALDLANAELEPWEEVVDPGGGEVEAFVGLRA